MRVACHALSNVVCRNVRLSVVRCRRCRSTRSHWRRRRVVNFTPRLAGFQSRSGRFGGEKLFCLAGNRTQPGGSVPRSNGYADWAITTPVESHVPQNYISMENVSAFGYFITLVVLGAVQDD